jgi:hypothetical protein
LARRHHSAHQRRALPLSRGVDPRLAPDASPRGGARRARPEEEDPVLDRGSRLQPRPRVHPNDAFDCGRVSAQSSTLVPVVSHAASDASSCCPEYGVSWTRRLAPTVHSLRRECGACNTLTASRCSACRSPLCFKCARGRIDCPRAQAARPRDEGRNDADAGVDAVAASPALCDDSSLSALTEVAATSSAARALCG